MGKIGLCFFISLWLVGCYNRVQFPSQTPSERVVEHSGIFLFWGLIGEGNYELYGDCPSGNVYEINSHTSLFQGILTAVSLGIYSPRTIEVICAAQLDKDGMPVNPQRSRVNRRSQKREEQRMAAPKKSQAMPMQKSPSMAPDLRPKPFDLN